MKKSENKAKSKRIRLNDIKVTVHIPDHISENVRREKINLIYDLLNPACRNHRQGKSALLWSDIQPPFAV